MRPTNASSRGQYEANTLGVRSLAVFTCDGGKSPRVRTFVAREQPDMFFLVLYGYCKAVCLGYATVNARSLDALGLYTVRG